MYVVTPGQQKGGVGKTTVTANLAAVSGEFGMRVLAVDLDPQSHLTFSFRQTASGPGRSIGDLLNESAESKPAFDDVVIRNVAPGVDLLPGDERALVRAEHDVAMDPLTGLQRLRKLLESVGDRYDLCYIDTPPKVEGLAVVAMVASDGVIVIAEPQTLSFASTQVYTAKVAQVKASLNPNLRLLGVLLNKVVEGEEADFITDQMRKSGLHVFETTIPFSRYASKAAASGVPTALMHSTRKIGRIYRDVADEMSDRLRGADTDVEELEVAAR